MRVALWHTTLPEPGRKPGGVDVGVHNIANALAETGDDKITVFSLSPRPADAAYQHKQLFADAQWLRQNKLATLFILPLLLNFVRFKGFDVLHLHGEDWFYLRRTLPTVRTLHGSALREARSATSLRRKLSQYVVYPLEHCSVKLATVPLAVGTDAARIYRVKDVVDAGVDHRLFYPGSKAPFPCILFVGTWKGRKRGKFLFETFTRYVLPKVPNAKLYMVSDFCLDHPRVIDATYPSDEVLAKLFREAWVCAIPSIYEGFGLPVLEALASGTAVVSSPNGGASHILAGGTYGIIADDASFGEHLVELLRDSHKRKALERAGKARSEEFTWAAVAARYREAYARAISKG